MLFEIPRLDTDFGCILLGNEELIGGEEERDLDVVARMLQSENEELIDCLCEEIIDFESVLYSWGQWEVACELLMRVYERDTGANLCSFLIMLMMRFDCMDSVEQMEVAEFLLGCDGSRFLPVCGEFCEFVCRVLVDDSISDVVRVRFLKLFMRLCDRRKLVDFVCYETDGAAFLDVMRALAADEDDDELNEYMREVVEFVE